MIRVENALTARKMLAPGHDRKSYTPDHLGNLHRLPLPRRTDGWLRGVTGEGTPPPPPVQRDDSHRGNSIGVSVFMPVVSPHVRPVLRVRVCIARARNLRSATYAAIQFGTPSPSDRLTSVLRRYRGGREDKRLRKKNAGKIFTAKRKIY